MGTYTFTRLSLKNCFAFSITAFHVASDTEGDCCFIMPIICGTIVSTVARPPESNSILCNVS